MKTRIKVFLGICISLLIIVIAMVFILHHLVTESFPKTSGSYTLSGLKDEVKIYRDAYGIPHIISSNELDGYFAIGFVQAQDRLWQMELFRRAGTGRLAEVLGEIAVPIDRMFRTIDITGIAHRIAATLPTDVHKSLQAYSDGVNAFIENHQNELPIEFEILKIVPKKWTIEHSIMISRLMAWELNMARFVDLALGQLVERVGKEKAIEAFPDWPSGAPYIIQYELKGMQITELSKDIINTDLLYRKLLGYNGLGSGSNTWVVSGRRTYTGKPLLANDPHLLLTSPGRWYELHISCPSLDVAGISIAGTPYIVVGRNRAIAWGITNVMLDDQDFYIEEVDSLMNPAHYKYNGIWKPLYKRIDTIKVKDSQTRIITILGTHRGPIVNGFEKPLQNSRYFLSMRWVGLDISDEVETFYRINHSSNWNQFKQALRTFGLPAQNFTYADTANNIGYYLGGKLPIRKTAGAIPFPGNTDEYDWKGYLPFEQMPNLFNPPEGFIITANNKVADKSFPYYISILWEPPFRAERIRELLVSKPNISIDDCEQMQLDVYSIHARQLVPRILKAFEGKNDLSNEVKTTLNYFRNWNYEMRKENVTTSLFQSCFIKLIENTFRDEMGDTLMALYDTVCATPINAMINLLQKPNSLWFDNINTPIVETSDEIIRLSLDEGIKLLRNTLGGDLKTWQWGELHQVEFKHPFGEIAALRPVFNVGPFPTHGAHSTVSKGDFWIGHPFNLSVGPSTRQIFDLSDKNNGRAVTPPGQSGQAFHKHYDDQIPLWINGGYRKMTLDKSNIENSGYELLRLIPKK